MIVALAGQGPPDTMAMGFSEYTNTFLLGEVPHLVVWGQVPVTAENPEKSKVAGNVGYTEVPGGAALLGGFGISVLPLLVFSLVVQKHMVQGLTSGAVRG